MWDCIKFSGESTYLNGTWVDVSGASTHIMRERWWLPLPLYKVGWELSRRHTHAPRLSWHSLPPSSRCTTETAMAWVAKHCRNSSSTTITWISVGGVRVDPLLPLPHWNEGSEVVIEQYVWSSMEALPIAALGFTILRLASDRLHHPHLCGVLSRFWSTRVSPSRQQFTCYYHLLD
jgi:hypothetical protein